MAVKIGHASISENGTITGKPGDQTGKEVCTRNWYLNSKGWRVFRAKDPAVAGKIAKCMQMACVNNNIGYNQHKRNTLYTYAEPYNFDVSKVNKLCETDCSALVRVCCAYAGIMGLPSAFRTGNMPSNLLETGAFVEMIGDKYTKKADYLGPGDILVTRTSGHTVVVLGKGKYYSGKAEVEEYKLGERILKKGMTGNDVKEMQANLIALGYNLGKYGADGDFGSSTDTAVRAFQKANKLTVDGEFGAKSLAKMNELLKDAEKEEEIEEPITESYLEVSGSSVNIREGDATSYAIIETVKKGSKLTPILDKDKKPLISETNWYAIRLEGGIGWICGKYVNWRE